MKHWFRCCLFPMVAWISACAPSPEKLYENNMQQIRDWYRQSLRVESPQMEAAGSLPVGRAGSIL